MRSLILAVVSSLALIACGPEIDPNIVPPINCADAGEYSCDGKIWFDAGPPAETCDVDGLPGTLQQNNDGSTSCVASVTPTFVANPR